MIKCIFKPNEYFYVDLSRVLQQHSVVYGKCFWDLTKVLFLFSLLKVIGPFIHVKWGPAT